jgi:MerR family transcriptional regulator, repressor of the yfmOP operon
MAKREATRRVAKSTDGQAPPAAHPVAASEQPSGESLRIDEVSKLTGLSKRTLRYYEQLGLLQRAQRSEGNYRMYRVEDVTALQRIKELRDLLGLELSEIRDILGYEFEREQARARWRQDEAPASRLVALADAERATRQQLHLIETRVAALEQMGQSLRERLALYERTRAEIMNQGARPE